MIRKRFSNSAAACRRAMLGTAVLSLTLLSLGCIFSPPGSQQPQEATAEVRVFADANRNGALDAGETGLPDTLLIAEHNIHGVRFYAAALTDAEGGARFSASYTHFFTVVAAPPCGAQATTPTRVDAAEEPRPRFGFVPAATAPTPRGLTIRLWEDRDRDGQHEPDEPASSGLSVALRPRLPSLEPGGEQDTDGILLQTDAAGEVHFNAGSYCGLIAARLTAGQWQTTVVTPTVTFKDGWLTADLAAGSVELEWGVAQAP